MIHGKPSAQVAAAFAPKGYKTVTEMLDAPVPPKFEQIPILRISESPTNPRKHFDQAKLEELAAGIRKHGVFEPILVRPNPMFKRVEDGAAVQQYQIIAGARRYRASILADLVEIPAIIREMDDKAVDECQLIENSHRDDMHPLEEADGYQRLVKQHGYTPQMIAERIGKSESYVYRRLKLAGLCQEAKDAWFAGRLTLEHYNILARLDPASQAKALPLAFHPDYKAGAGGTDYRYPPDFESPLPAKSFEDAVRREFFLSLKSAPWDKTDAKLYPKAGACANCEKRTGASPMLFDQAETDDNCLDSECFEKKRGLHLVQIEKEAAKKGASLVRVATSWASPSQVKELNCLAVHGAYEKVTKKNPCDYTQKAVVVHGDNVGATFDVCTAKKCKVHMGKPAGSGSSCTASAADQEHKRKREIEEAVSAALVKGILAKVPKKLGAREFSILAAELAAAGNLNEVAELVGWKIPARTADWKAERNAFLGLVRSASEAEVTKVLMACCLQVMTDGYNDQDDELPRIAREYGLDPKVIEMEATAAVNGKYAAQEKPKVEAKKAAPAKKAPAKPRAKAVTVGQAASAFAEAPYEADEDEEGQL